MAVTYTTAAIVKKQVKNISASLLDADIEQNINQVEGTIDLIMKATARGSSSDFTFDADKHGTIRNCATAYATYLCILYDVSEFATIDDLEATLNSLWTVWATACCLLGDPRHIEYLKSL